MSEEWGPWIEHDGKGCPVPFGTFLHVVTIGGKEQIGPLREEGASGVTYFEWQEVIRYQGRDDNCIIRYRIRKPKGLTILENLISEIPQPQERIEA